MLCKYGFNCLVFMFIWLLSASCNESKETDVFTLPSKSRQALIQEGYKSYQFRIGGEIEIFDNILHKVFDDTVVKYVFQDDVLERIEVGFNIHKLDSGVFFHNCEKKGFVKTKPIDKIAKMAFIEPTKQIHYDVNMGKSEVNFVHYFARLTYSPPAIIDTVSPAK